MSLRKLLALLIAAFVVALAFNACCRSADAQVHRCRAELNVTTSVEDYLHMEYATAVCVGHVETKWYFVAPEKLYCCCKEMTLSKAVFHAPLRANLIQEDVQFGSDWVKGRHVGYAVDETAGKASGLIEIEIGPGKWLPARKLREDSAIAKRFAKLIGTVPQPFRQKNIVVDRVLTAPPPPKDCPCD